MSQPCFAEYSLVGDIYDAALDPARWPAVLQGVSELGEAHSAIIVALDMLNPAYNLVIPWNLHPDSLVEYRERGLDQIDMEVNGLGLVRHAGIGRSSNTWEIYGSLEAWRERAGEFYRFLDRYDVASMAGIALDHDDYRWSCLGIHRSERMGPFGSHTLSLLDRLGPHIRRALQVHRQLSLQQSQVSSLHVLLDQLQVGVVLLDENAQVSWANARARQLIRSQGALRVTRFDGLQAAQAGQNGNLQAIVRGAIETARRAGNRMAGGGTLRLAGSEGRALMVTAAPLGNAGPYQVPANSSVAAALFISDPDEGHILPADHLASHYGLSAREVGICQQFVNTPGLPEIAAACGLSHETVRTYLKTIYDKTGQHSQAELMRLLMGLRRDFDHIL